MMRIAPTAFSDVGMVLWAIDETSESYLIFAKLLTLIDGRDGISASNQEIADACQGYGTSAQVADVIRWLVAARVLLPDETGRYRFRLNAHFGSNRPEPVQSRAMESDPPIDVEAIRV